MRMAYGWQGARPYENRCTASGAVAFGAKQYVAPVAGARGMILLREAQCMATRHGMEPHVEMQFVRIEDA